MSSKRHSILPSVDRSGPRPPVNFSSSITISQNAVLRGTHSITVQSETVIQPRARITSSLGSILIGRRCLINENSHLGAQPEDMTSAAPGGVSVGDYVVIDVGAQVEAGGTEIGDGSVVAVGCTIGSGAKIGKHCTITSMSVIDPGDVLPDYTVVYSNGLRRLDGRDVIDTKKMSLVKQLGMIRKMIPNAPEKFQ